MSDLNGRSLDHLALAASPFLPIIGAAAVGGYLGCAHGQGLPVDNGVWYMAGIPAGSMLLYPRLRNGANDPKMCERFSGPEAIGQIFRAIAVAGSAVAGPVGYGAGYLAGRLTS